ncbi:unnamed protein product [Mytilus edulis]|uniref:Uncharacterized protein n=1 Tax=Mytilus edulis TaxID=6550 RepID=A0A8S3S0H4_MYTED|nr:unnamed protein product [Mytilus edulis]
MYQLSFISQSCSSEEVSAWILPVSLTDKKTTQGYRAAKHDFTFKNCDANPNSYITFYYNPNNTYPSRPGLKVGIDSNEFMTGWIGRSSTLNRSKHMGKEFFFDFEMHMGGCGGFMTSYSVKNISAALGLPVYKDYTQTLPTVTTVSTTDAVVVTNATTSTFTNEYSNDIGMVTGLVVGLVLVILVLAVVFMFIRRCFGSSKFKEPKDCYTRSQNIEMARGTGHPNNTYLDLNKTTTDYPYQNLTNSEVSGRKQDLKQTNLNYDYATVEPSTEQGYISEMISKDAASNNYLVLDPNITGYNRSEDKTKTDQYELAQPINTSREKTSFDNTTYITDDTYALSEEGVYDSSRDNRHKESTNNIYSHTVDTVYDSSSRSKSDSERQDTYDHCTGRKTEDEYDISKCS